MKILHIDDTFHPNYGYQCNPLAKFQQRHGNEVYIIAPTADCLYPLFKSFGDTGDHMDEYDAAYEELTGVKILRVQGKGYIWGRLNYIKKDLYKAIEDINPDVIMLHCIETLTAMRVMKRYKNKYPMVTDSHMLAMATANKLAKLYEIAYRVLYTSIIKRKKYTVILTQDDDYVIKHLGVPKEQTKFISFGTDTLLFCPDPEVKKKFLQDNGLPENTFVITSTGKLGPAKDGKLLGKTLKEKFNNRPVAAVIIGSFKTDYEKEVKADLDASENKIFFYPVQKYINLGWFYKVADVTVFPRQCSMSFYDAQACGSPVISEKGHVNEERNSHGNGLNFECGSVEDFRAKIQQMIDMPEEEYKQMRQNSYEFVAKTYSYDVIAKQYTDELQKAYDAFHKK